MKLITQILKSLLGKYVVMYLGDVLIDMRGNLALKSFSLCFSNASRKLDVYQSWDVLVVE